MFHRLFTSDDFEITLEERIRNEEDIQKRKLWRIVISVIIVLIALFPYICIPILFVLVTQKKTNNNVSKSVKYCNYMNELHMLRNE